ncbi:MAG TPA: alpha-1,4-glucan--maltose-1-phosphate maltosyltransferase [Desulfobulbaceae bacterium]|nr:alpha-1,4-glucan--maltose-1-phosphate maltosyltransferase [Desulfobulbaceae bacterium]
MSQDKPQVRLPDEMAARVSIERIRPRIDCGRFPIKRTVGEKVVVTAYIFADGHDLLQAVLQYRHAEEEWIELPMTAFTDDLWRGEFVVEHLGSYSYTVRAWIDHFASWQRDLLKKADAGQDVASDLLEGAAMIEATARRAQSPDDIWLSSIAEMLATVEPQEKMAARATAPDVTAMMKRYPERLREAVFTPALTVTVEQRLAGFSAWYELFPRSVTQDPEKSGTFRAVERILPDIARMGFDVLYLPPIHPIGRTNRKGRNNSLMTVPGDPGSPWAIGSEDGGHKAVHPDLGTLEDFEHLVASARRQGLEIALDIALQCSPDHPYIREHPEWFRHRPDGSLKFAENPPKKYEDIYPICFDCEEWQPLWHELKSIFLFWIERGVKLFRVDNPHTKPLSFWEWLIAEVRQNHPETVFLSEAFTRPRVMYGLAKAGFSQSYTYFTWRNTKYELTAYLRQLVETEVSEYFRPNFFANTPDILPEFLQFGGRAAFISRLVLAATLSSCYGIYSGYELLENEAVPGTEEYLNSEKFEIKVRDWNLAGNIRPFIARINTIRRKNAALASNAGLSFYPVDNEQLLFYGKSTEDLTNIILVAVNLDPHHVQEGMLELPLEQFRIEKNEVFQVHELIFDNRFLWQGRRNYVRLDPAESPAQIFLLRRKLRTERDFDYFM